MSQEEDQQYRGLRALRLIGSLHPVAVPQAIEQRRHLAFV